MLRLRTRLRAGASSGAPASLNLDFLGTSNTLDNRITFSRGSQATLTDSTGKLTYAPNNLLTNSESFEATAWTKGGVTVTANSATAPDGTVTADKLIEDSTTGEHRAFQAITAISGIAYIYSIYAKSSERSRIQLTSSTGVVMDAVFDLSNGTVVAATSGAASITSVGSGWYRCTIVATANSTNSTNIQIRLIQTGTTNSYTGTTGSGLFIWGAQLEQVTYQTTPSTYNSTTPKNLLGFTQEIDNAAWTKSNAFVQTNLVLTSTFSTLAGSAGSQYPSGTGWSNFFSTGGTRTFVVSSVFAGSQAMDIAAVSAARNVIGFSFTPSASTTYTVSFYVENVSGATGIVAYATGTLGTGGTTNNVTAPTTTGRYSYTFTTGTASGTVDLRFGIGCATNESGSIRISNVQLVQGSTAGNYQPTYASAAAVQYTAPDGTLSADNIVTTSANSAATQTVTASTTASYVGSVYIKYVSGSQNVRLRLALTGGTAVAKYVAIDAVTGALVASDTTYTITDAGNGWWRISAAIANNGTNTSALLQLYATNDTVSTNSILVWGAQLSNSASLDPYVYNPGAAPSSAAYYGPRFDYDPVTLQQKGLLIEEQRTNLLTYSSDWTNAAWSKSNLTVTAAATTSPDGTVNAQKLAATTTASTNNSTAGIAATATTASFSVYVKQGSSATTANSFALRNNTTATNLVLGTLNYSTGVWTYSTGSTGVTVSNAGNGWWRLQISASSGITAGDLLICYVGFLGASATAGDFLYAYGAQLEAGSFATSYIPTVASTVTRSADNAQMLGDNFLGWYNQNQGTISVEADSSSTLGHLFSADDGTANNRIYGIAPIGQAVFNGIVTAGSTVYSQSIGLVTANVPLKSATGYNLNDCNSAVNAQIGTLDTSATMPAVNRLRIGQNVATVFTTGHFRRITYYPQRLPDYQLQRLTA